MPKIEARFQRNKLSNLDPWGFGFTLYKLVYTGGWSLVLNFTVWQCEVTVRGRD